MGRRRSTQGNAQIALAAAVDVQFVSTAGFGRKRRGFYVLEHRTAKK
jgi:hypothetical protein